MFSDRAEFRLVGVPYPPRGRPVGGGGVRHNENYSFWVWYTVPPAAPPMYPADLHEILALSGFGSTLYYRTTSDAMVTEPIPGYDKYLQFPNLFQKKTGW